ncbi:MAG: hypothetical protein JJ895_15195 [Balneolaceae bacterium]|nr:hypothetical protein [Balneolaceae bacterium]
MKINKNDIAKAFYKVSSQTKNQFWGVLSIISTIDSKILPGNLYDIDIEKFKSTLDQIFYFGDVSQLTYSGNNLNVIFSERWKVKLSQFTYDTKPSILDCAIMYNWHNNYQEDSIKAEALISAFDKQFNISKNGLLDLFEKDDRSIIYFEDYNQESLRESFENHFETDFPKDYHLSIDKPFIKSAPHELNRAPFYQTLYSGESIKELLLVFTGDIAKLYSLSNHSTVSIDKSERFEDFINAIKKIGYQFNSKQIYRFIGSLITKPFLILTGLSGSGKTKIAQAFAKWICESDTQYKLIPVGADWTNREPLFGYPNALQEGKYVLPESGALQLILEAKENPDLPFFLILDEMNLSHVERYFADFLSAMESDEEILLHSGETDWNGVPSKLQIPKNLFIIGTVNIDETTYMFSPKVLDRANVIEFRVSKIEMKTYLDSSGSVILKDLKGKGAVMAKSFVEIATKPTEEYADKEKLNHELILFFNELKTVGAEFGYRSAAEIRRFAGISAQLAPDWNFEKIMDAAISQKLLPKLHGSRRKLEKVLYQLGDLCYPDLEKGCADLFTNHENITPELITEAKYPISFEKITRMHKGLTDNGFTSFAEA